MIPPFGFSVTTGPPAKSSALDPDSPPPLPPQTINNDPSLKSGSLEKTTVKRVNFSFLAQHRREIGDRSVIGIISHLFYYPV